jgi:pimeloyl-ACP methyl ester carboxylesterase
MPTFATFDGIRLTYDDQGDGPPVLLIHGFAADTARNWDRPGVTAALLGAGRRVIALDARGHGRSDKPHDPQAYADRAMVRDVQALLDHLGLAEVDAVGYSMGALVTLGALPVERRIRAAVLGGIGDAISRGLPDRAAVADALEADDPSSVPSRSARAFRHFADATGADRRALAAIQRAQDVHGPFDLAAIDVPVLVLTGDADTLVGSPHDLAARIRGARAEVVTGDHLGAVDDPAFPAAIVAFLAGAGITAASAG